MRQITFPTTTTKTQEAPQNKFINVSIIHIKDTITLNKKLPQPC